MTNYVTLRSPLNNGQINLPDGTVVTADAAGLVTVDTKWMTELLESGWTLESGGVDVLGVPLTGLSTATGGPVTATDTTLTAFGRLEHRTNLAEKKAPISVFDFNGGVPPMTTI